MNWNLRFNGDIENRPVKLWAYGDSGELKVETTQLGDFADPTIVMVISDGDKIEFEATDTKDLVVQLLDVGFTEAGAREIARFGEPPTAQTGAG
jgi:hypothetical protein